ncbi:alpha/beta hydrolase family esterase [Flagellimonas myxillae]|uniref:alpha/beta hydrolase family esterase n=1 Tax=Flagellimonas myxillae TaxID=2942214 RepID=UPI00201EBAA3|nr:PHB depolymerase family esterase [Muricauda myxillae]MCL6268209.1 hypothetical protein [Muricauda myxillae]
MKHQIKHKLCLIFGLVVNLIQLNAQLDHERVYIQDSLLINDIWRTFEYHIPQFPGNSCRLVFVLHDAEMNSRAIQELTGFEFNRLADKTAGTIVVYPQGHNNDWNIADKTHLDGIDDLQFIKSIVRRMERRYDIDRSNVFAVGYFKGGNLCYTLAEEIPEFFKGFAIIGANMPSISHRTNTHVVKPTSIMVINDMRDSYNLFNGHKHIPLEKREYNIEKSTNESFEHWLQHLDQGKRLSAPIEYIIKKSNSLAYRFDYFNRENSKLVSLIKIENGGYSFPNPNAMKWPQAGQNSNKQINIPELVMDYFYRLQYEVNMNMGK